jgi:hydroxylaminobenzene mutase
MTNAMAPAVSQLRRRVARAGATLFAVGLFTGLWSALALTGKVKVDEPHLALAAHTNALLGGLWLLALAFTFEYLHYGERGLRALTWLTLVPSWGNWAVTLIASVVGRRGLDYDHDARNSLIAALLQVVVVLPGLVGSVMWAWGFRDRRAERG